MIPVSNPARCSMNTRSSVAMLPVAAGVRGQPPMPPTAGIDDRHPVLDRREDVGQTGVPGVVEMDPPRQSADPTDLTRPEQSFHRPGIGHADGVGQCQLVHPGTGDRSRQAQLT